MPSKSVSDTFPVFSSALGNQTMTGTTTLISQPSSCKFRDTITYQVSWTGSPTGTFGVQISNDYNPGLPESAYSSGAQNSGTWTDVTLSPTPISGGFTNGTITLSLLGGTAVRCIYMNATGTGVLSGTFSAKSLGI